MNYKEIIDKQINNYISDDMQKSLESKINNLSSGLTEEFSLKNIINSTLEGKSIFEDTRLIENIKDLILYEIKTTIQFGVEILIVCIFLSLISAISSEKELTKVQEISKYIGILIISGLIINNFTKTYNYSLESITNISSVITIVIPIIIGILIASGKIVSGGILSPFLLSSIEITTNLISQIVMPILMGSLILIIANSITETDYVNRLSALLGKSALIITGGLCTILLGILKVQGLLSETADGLLVNAAKYSLGNFIPIVGSFSADTMELFIKSMATIGSVFGVFSIISIALVLLIPIVKTFIIGLLYKIISIIIQPITDSKIANTISAIGSNFFIQSAVILFIGILFIFFINIIINLGA